MRIRLLFILALAALVAFPAVDAPAKTRKKCTVTVKRTKHGKKRKVRTCKRVKVKTRKRTISVPKAQAAPTPAADPGAAPAGDPAPAAQPVTGHKTEAPESDPGNGPLPNLTGCDEMDPDVCLYPFPNDLYTVRDESTATKRRVDLSALATPRNVAGKPVVPTDWNRSDGFSPGSMMITKVPGLDNEEAFQKTGAVPVTDMARSFDPAQPIVVIDADTLERHLIWAELDSNAKADSDRTLIIRPGVNLAEGHRYIVALRNLKDKDGKTIEARTLFKAYRDKTSLDNPIQEQRRGHMESLFRTLGKAGVGRDELYLAWDFTVASAQNTTGRMLHIRDESFKALGDTNLADMKVEGGAPAVTNLKAEDNPNEKIARRITGTMTVPCWLDTPKCVPVHSEFILDPRTGMPTQIPGNTMDVDFECEIPKAAVAGGTAHPARPSLYGHGLFGGYDEVQAGNVESMGNENDMMFCATAWTGMAFEDIPNVATILTDLSHFPSLTDRLQQGVLNFLYLGRLMIHPEGLAAHDEFKLDGQPLIDTTRLFYDGNSQGGIFGGTLTAVAPDFDHAALGVPGMNYSTLLTRSTDFGDGSPPHAPADPDPSDPEGTLVDGTGVNYAYPLYTSYPKEIERPLLFALMQMLWDRSDPNGYAAHMTSDPLPNTPAHEVLMQSAVGDHQVSNLAAEVEARTIGAKMMRKPALDPGRHADVDPWYGIPAAGSVPFSGSAYVPWDSGSAVAPTANVAPKDGPGVAADPHGHPRGTLEARQQKGAFLRVGGKVVDTCGGGPCYANR